MRGKQREPSANNRAHVGLQDALYFARTERRSSEINTPFTVCLCGNAQDVMVEERIEHLYHVERQPMRFSKKPAPDGFERYIRSVCWLVNQLANKLGNVLYLQVTECDAGGTQILFYTCKPLGEGWTGHQGFLTKSQ